MAESIHVYIPPIDEEARREAKARQARLTKPAGSLGRLEDLSISLAGMTGRLDPPLANRVVFTLAADHGVALEGVSAYPRDVTAQMVLNFLNGGAAINVLARQMNARVVVADLGVDADLPPHPELHALKVRRGTASITKGPAMSLREARRAIDHGRRLAREEIANGLDVVLTGDMGIGNTTASAALICALTQLDPKDVVGRGTGVDDVGLERKRQAVRRLGLRPLLELDLRLGEGTGAVLALPLLEAAVRILNEMATFDEAGVSERDEEPAHNSPHN